MATDKLESANSGSGNMGSSTTRDSAFQVEGMTCAACVARVERVLNKVDGVENARVNLATERVVVSYDDEAASEKGLIDAVQAAGYSVSVSEVTMSVGGMSCAACASRVERALSKASGVLSVAVNLASERATVTFLTGATTVEQLAEAVENAGYEVLTLEGDTDRLAIEREAREHERASLKRRLLISAAGLLPILVLSMLPMLVPSFGAWLNTMLSRQEIFFLQFIPATIVQFGPALPFYKSGWKSTIQGSPDMNALVMLGTTAAYGYSVVATFFPAILPEGTVHVYFEASAMIVTIILVGRYLESIVKGRTGDAITQLMQLQAREAYVVKDGNIEKTPVDRVRIGDLLAIGAGQQVPVDSLVEEGMSWLDESMITGEPMPALREKGDEVIGGTINGNGTLRVRVTRVGNETLLSQIIRVVEEAQAGRAPIQAVADRVVAYFVPAVISIALISFALWMIFGPRPALTLALVNAVAVLIVACPCAMGLATPMSIMVGSGKAAQSGVLFRRGDAIQRLQEIDIVALDKTGTLTEGRPVVRSIRALEGWTDSRVLATAAALEHGSAHPVAHAILEEAQSRDLELNVASNVTAEPGYGVTGLVDGIRVEVGGLRYMEELGRDVNDLRNLATGSRASGVATVYLAVDGKIAGTVTVADRIKEEAPATIRYFHELGKEVVMITGDEKMVAEEIAGELGIDRVIADVLPTGKADVVAELGRTGKKVLFVGDGINDAPALAKADTGIAIGTGTDVAIETADVVLMSGDTRGVARAFALSRTVMRNIKQNLFWAFCYNILLIPVAAGILYPAYGILMAPAFAAAAMGASDVFVVGNALRLKRFTPPVLAASGSV